MSIKIKRSTISIIAAALLGTTNLALAEQAVDLGAVGTTGSGVSGKVDKESASYAAPSQTSLTATEPQSIISQHFIEENATAGANYTDIISFTPSVMSVDPNGPGGMENQNVSIRGFQDGQFNLTFDGIPIGDTNDFTHHTTSFFMNQDIGEVVVDRGPGDASQVGYATFGGTVAMNSKAPTNTAGTSLLGSFGSWNTALGGVQFNSGTMQNYGDAKAYFSYKNYTTDGYLTNSGQRRQNLFLKFEKPLSDDTTLTFVATGNKLHQNVPLGQTPDQIALHGQNFGLSSDPTRQDYAGYNLDMITTDFEYVGIKTSFGNWKLDDKLYTYAYSHTGYTGGTYGSGGYTAGVDLAGMPSLNGTSLGANNVPGVLLNNDYRSFGNILRASREMGADKLDLGIWIDRQRNSESVYEVDWTQNGAFNYSTPQVGGTSANINYPGTGYTVATSYIDTLGSQTLTTIQPYVQYTWKPTDSWTFLPGLKYSSFTRDSEFSYLKANAGVPKGTFTYSRLLPSLTTRYAVSGNWSVYGQYSEGFLAPRQQLLVKAANINPASIQPELTENFQLGTNWSSKSLVLGADVYHILTHNATVLGSSNQFVPANGISYSGVELEGTVRLLKSLSLYGNYSINNFTNAPAHYATAGVVGAPHNTAAAGLVYDQGGLYTSLLAKYVGDNFTNNTYFGGYTIANLNMSYKPNMASLGKDTKLSFQVNNLLNRTGIYSSINADGAGNNLYYTLPERSYMLSLSLGL
jgi:iron complex outermembrane receptor protein